MSLLQPKQFALLKREWHDVGLRSIPDTFPRQDASRPLDGAGKGEQILITDWMRAYVTRHNTDKANRWIFTPGGAIVNAKDGTRAEQIGFGGCVVQITKSQNNHARIVSYAYNAENLPEDSTWYKHPYLWSKGSAVDSNLTVTNPTSGIDAYFPTLRTGAELWVPEWRIERFPLIPAVIGLPVTARIDIPNKYKAGETFRVFDYKCLGASVYGYTAKGWLFLLRRRNPSEYAFSTNWKLQTQTPIPGV